MVLKQISLLMIQYKVYLIKKKQSSQHINSVCHELAICCYAVHADTALMIVLMFNESLICYC